MTSISERRQAFRKLHESGCFVLPNPWDVGTARYLHSLGFLALATTSSGFAFAQGKPDGAITRDKMLAHIRAIVEATDLPVNADYEDGHAKTLTELADSVRLCVETGVAGLSIEDSTGEASRPLYDFDEAVDRIRAARAAIDAAGGETMLIGRAECLLVGHPDPVNEAIRRLTAYAEAGADCLYAPGLRRREDIEAVVKAVAPKPVNVLAGAWMGLTLADLAALGVRRVSVGGALALAAWSGFAQAAQGLKEGRFDPLGGAISHADLNAFFEPWR